MKANEFIKKFGWDEAIKFAGWYGGDTAFKYIKVKKHTVSVHSGDQPYDFHVNDLKRYVDAYELVQFIGGINSAKAHIMEVIRDYDDAVTNDWKIYDHDIKIGDIKQAITLVEQCYNDSI